MKGNEKTAQSEKKSSRFSLEVTTKVLGALVGVGMLVYSIYSYFDARALEARRPLLESQFKLYQEAVDAAGRLATVECGNEDQDCIKSYATDCRRFISLYWGGLGVVEDRLVEGAMVKFRNEFDKSYPTLCEPQSIEEVATTSKSSETGYTDLQDASLNLAHCVNASIENSWGIRLLQHDCKSSTNPTWWERVLGIEAKSKPSS